MVNTKTLSVNIPHRLAQDEARQRLQNGITDLKSKYAGKVADVAETWNGNQMNFKMTAMGQSITGRVDVLPEAVKLDIDLPWLFAMFAEKFKPQVEAEARKMLEQKK